MLTKYTPVQSATICTCAREREQKQRKEKKKKEYSSLRSTSSFFMHRVVSELGKKYFFFLQICSPLFFGKVSGSWFLRGRPKDKTRKRDKRPKKKCFRVMTEGDSSEQQLIVILSRMRGWGFHSLEFSRCLRQLLGGKSDTLSA